MTEDNQKKLLRIYRIVFSVATGCLGIALAVQLWGIYHSKSVSPFSRASVGAALKEILPVILLWFACWILNIVLTRLYPQKQRKLKGSMDISVALSGIKKRFANGGKGVAGTRRVRIFRCAASIVGAVAIVFCLAWGVAYFFDKNYEIKRVSEFFEERNGVADRTLSALPWLLAAAAIAVVVAALEEYFQKRELALLQAAMVEELRRKKSGEEIENPVLIAKGEEVKTTRKRAKPIQSTKLVWIARGVLCVSAVVLIVLGVHWGGMDLVFEKARTICQQCIGLG